MSLNPTSLFTQNKSASDQISSLEAQVDKLRNQVAVGGGASYGGTSVSINEAKNEYAHMQLTTLNWIVRQSALLKLLKANNIEVTEDFIQTFKTDIEEMTNILLESTNRYTHNWHQQMSYDEHLADPSLREPMAQKQEKVLKSLKFGR